MFLRFAGVMTIYAVIHVLLKQREWGPRQNISELFPLFFYKVIQHRPHDDDRQGNV